MNEPCPVCAADGAAPLLRPMSVPALMNRLYATPAEARAAARGTLALLGCRLCGFVWNRAFRADAIAYDGQYENDQSHSPAFQVHVAERARAVVAAAPAGPIDYVEVGCGQGGFIAAVAHAAGPRLRSAVGFDPAWRSAAPPGVTVHPRMFDDAAARLLAHRPNLVAARHVIEHVPDPVGFLTSICRVLGPEPDATLFLETPCVDWIMAHVAMHDLFYEHCSLFTGPALRHALSATGFGPATVETVFGGQYLWASAPACGAAAGAALPERHAPGPLDTALEDFVRQWRARLGELAAHGSIAIWGAGAKGTSFALLADPDAGLLGHAIDINPAKQGLFLAGSGLPVLAPAQSALLRPGSVVVMNPNYLDEVAALLAPLSPETRLVQLA